MVEDGRRSTPVPSDRCASDLVGWPLNFCQASFAQSGCNALQPTLLVLPFCPGWYPISASGPPSPPIASHQASSTLNQTAMPILSGLRLHSTLPRRRPTSPHPLASLCWGPCLMSNAPALCRYVPTLKTWVVTLLLHVLRLAAVDSVQALSPSSPPQLSSLLVSSWSGSGVVRPANAHTSGYITGTWVSAPAHALIALWHLLFPASSPLP